MAPIILTFEANCENFCLFVNSRPNLDKLSAREPNCLATDNILTTLSKKHPKINAALHVLERTIVRNSGKADKKQMIS